MKIVKENREALIVWLLLFSLLTVVGYIGFFQDRKSGDANWYLCMETTSNDPEAQLFSALDASAQAFIKNKWEAERKLFDSLPNLIATLESIKAKINNNSDPEIVKSIQSRIIQLKQIDKLPMEKQSRSFSNPDGKYYVCYK